MRRGKAASVTAGREGRAFFYLFRLFIRFTQNTVIFHLGISSGFLNQLERFFLRRCKGFFIFNLQFLRLALLGSGTFQTLFHHLLSLIHDRSYRFDQELFQ